MKKHFSLKVAMCIIALITLTFPLSAQDKMVADEYQETLNKIMELSGASTTISESLMKALPLLKKNKPDKDDAYWDEFVKTFGEKTKCEMMDICTPIYKRYLTLDDLNKIVEFYESAVGQKYKESAIAIMREATPVLTQRLVTDLGKEMMVTRNVTLTEARPMMGEHDRIKNRDRELSANAYLLPSDSIEVNPWKVYESGMSTTPTLYSIETREDDTKVTFLQPIYWDSQWLYFSPGYRIVDKKSGDEYVVRGYDGGAPMGRLLKVEGFNKKYIYISLIFPKLKKNVKVIDILELPHEGDEAQLPSNDDGIAKSYYNVRLKDFKPHAKKKVNVYY
ncbi:DUF2059 domain-containing protein [uncultured Bacteroides sp.]|uniref:DUF2059 domain-containing protein n=1 Tax=uncultured Bacteroides sp. TaxID=162156 RepID=UPI0025F1837B|nr:DUF2059 domain-containing protein [uncultured Bacteroides sp.]